MRIQRGPRTTFAALSVAAMLRSNDAIASSSTSSSICIALVRGDGHCDLVNNNDNCGYDGGDCCQCTCTSTLEWSCGANGFHCVDPSASCVGDDDGTIFPDATTTSLGCVRAYSGDGECDLDNNNKECGYDGGDCCQCTCVSTPALTCGISGFACVDPSAPCVGDGDGTVVSNTATTWSGCISEHFGDGDCDTTNNSEECGYDFGDCCQCTCVSTTEFTCGVSGFHCVDPRATCDDDDDVTVVSYTPTSASLDCIPDDDGDGYCDPVNNKDGCGYDGGDCCQCTCVDTATWRCGTNGFQCVDPGATCVGDDDATVGRISESPTLSTDDTTSSSDCIGGFLGDGFCDSPNNNEDCGYDNGDCCPCTCVSTPEYTCDMEGFQCVDPNASCADLVDLDTSISPSGDEMLGSYSFSESDEDNSGNSAAVSTLAVPLYPLLFATLVSPCIFHICRSSL